MLYNLWPFKYRQYVTLLGHFTAGYSGKVMLWYWYDHNQLVRQQKRLNQLPETYRCTDKNPDDIAMKCHICRRMGKRESAYGCQIETIPEEDNFPHFRMLSFDSTALQVLDSSTSGPLVPFLIDGDKGWFSQYLPFGRKGVKYWVTCHFVYSLVVVFEYDVPDSPGYSPDYTYLSESNVGSRVRCTVHGLSDQSQDKDRVAPP